MQVHPIFYYSYNSFTMTYNYYQFFVNDQPAFLTGDKKVAMQFAKMLEESTSHIDDIKNTPMSEDEYSNLISEETFGWSVLVHEDDDETKMCIAEFTDDAIYTPRLTDEA